MARPRRMILAGMGAGTLVADYALQLTVVQPALLTGETAGLSPWSQSIRTASSSAWRNAGYATLSLAMLFLGVATIRQSSKLGRAASWLFTAGVTATLAVLVVFAAVYRARLDHRFEVLALGITWLVLAAGGVVLAVMFARTPVARAPQDKRAEAVGPERLSAGQGRATAGCPRIRAVGL